MRYTVYISEIRYGTISVEADSEEKAEQAVKKALDKPESYKLIEWHDSEISDITVVEK